MSLPLLARTTDDDARYVLTPIGRGRHTENAERMPLRTPGAGEQYRFHFDMASCIGCKCCVVACNEQNGNPAEINWRRVGEIEGGFFPMATQHYLSMGCNHCVDPTCLEGCPVDAYTKDPATGIVLHSAEACIGCQYCTWNCSYGVPQYNPDRGVVGKCDMCHGRLELGQAPACVSACPEGAIAIEIVKTVEWRAELATTAPGQGTPTGDGSLSTTRVTMPALPPNARPVDLTRVVPEHPHWSLVLMTVLTQLSVGSFVTIWLLELLGSTTSLRVAAVTSLVVAALALNAATFHLGRPAHAYRALKAWRRSWLSREVLLFAAFSGVATLYAAVLWLALPGGVAIGAATALVGVAGVLASACIYRVPSRPSWNTPLTLVQFNLTAASLGPLMVRASGASDARWLGYAAAAMGGAQLLLIALRLVRLVASDRIELRGTARLLSTTLRRPFLARVALVGVGGVALPLADSSPALSAAALALALAGEIVGRYLFFASVVPTHMTAPYLETGSEAA
jgi:Fe-S-cluster-containing dehydrogenase component/DMSO reductase anchor subunit